jgi:hypothetical protein
MKKVNAKTYNKQLNFVQATNSLASTGLRQPISKALYILREFAILIRAINSQRKLKPYFYSQSAKVGAVGCILALAAIYPIFSLVASVLDIDVNVPLRSYEGSTVLIAFGLCLLALVLTAYIFCALSAFVYYGFKFKNGLIDKQELFNIVFKGIYPKRWQRGL